jgi:hypothetical protein
MRGLRYWAGRKEAILGKDDPGESTKKPSSPAEQHQRFIETARALECDEDKERFEQKLKRIARAPKRSKVRQGRDQKGET